MDRRMDRHTQMDIGSKRDMYRQQMVNFFLSQRKPGASHEEDEQSTKTGQRPLMVF